MATHRRPTSPYLPTPTERLVLLIYPALLLLGTVFSLVSPQTRAAPFDAAAGAHAQDPALAPSYFARKDNIVNTLFVKRGWAWISLALAAFAASSRRTSYWSSSNSNNTSRDSEERKGKSTSSAPSSPWTTGARWLLATVWWFLVTQWCFGPAVVDRGFRWSGGGCEGAVRRLADGEASGGDVFTAAACKAAGGRWSGGHDISGHVFMLVLGSGLLLEEVGWAILRRWGGFEEERTVVADDGSVQVVDVWEGRRVGGREGDVGDGNDGLGLGVKAVLVVVALSLWMILMTAIYFHTWFEKVS